MSQNSVNTPSIDSPYRETFKTTLAELGEKVDDANSAIQDLSLLFATQSDEISEVIEKLLFEEIRTLRVELTKVIKTEIAAALSPHRRLVPAVRPRIPESATDLTSTEEEDEESDEDSDDSIKPAQKRSKLAKYTEH